MDGDRIQAAVALGVVVVVLWRGSRAVDDRTVRRWERRFGVALPAELRIEAAGRLRRDRTLRAVAVGAGLLIGATPAFVNLVAPERAGDVANPAVQQAWLMAAAGGALLAEALVSGRPAGPREAAVVRRRVGDYIEPGWVGITVALAVLAVVAAVAGSQGDAPGRGWWWVHAAGGLLAVGATGYGLRLVRDRAMPAADGPRRDLEEAMRADGAHHLVGAGVALAASSAAGGLWLVADAAPAVGVVASLVALAALGWWWTLARSARWNVPARRLTTA